MPLVALAATSLFFTLLFLALVILDDIEQLLDCTVEQLEAMSDDKLLQHFDAYLKLTEPKVELAKPKTARKKRAPKEKKTLLDQAELLKKTYGIT